MPVYIRRKDNSDFEFNRKLGQRLRDLRRKAGYYLQDVQDMTGMHYTLLSRVEMGDSRITIFELLGLASIYEANLDELFEGLWDYLEVSD